MPGDNGRRGLCLNCINVSQCTFPVAYGQSVTQCEEFKCDGVPLQKMFPRSSSTSLGSVVAALHHGDNHGLCEICENAPQCTYPKSPDQVIAQCDDYC